MPMHGTDGDGPLSLVVHVSLDGYGKHYTLNITV